MDNLAYDYRTSEDDLYEIIEGVKIMSPSPNAEHGGIVMNLGTIFNYYCWTTGAGRVFGDNIDVHFPDGNLFRPDFSVVCDFNIIKRQGTIYGVPDLLIEILSRSTMKSDIGLKKHIYERNGVKEYWIINPWIKTIEVYHLIDGKFNLDNLYQLCSEEELAQMSEEEQAALKYEIKVSIFDDLMVDIHKVFMFID